MLPALKSRLSFAWRVARTRLFAVIEVLWALLSNAAQARDWFVPVAWQTRLGVDRMPDWPWYVWAIGALVILTVAILDDAYRVSQRLESEVNATRDSLAKARADVDALSARWEQDNRGISIKAVLLEFSFDDAEILAILMVENIVNGNNRPAALQVALKAPFRLGGMQIIASTRASSLPPKDFTTPYPQFHAVLNLGAKEARGPGYFAFEFTHKYLTGAFFPFKRDTAMKVIAEQLSETELIIELTDLANSDKPIEIDAPGTFEKRHRRRVAETAKSTAQAET